MYIVETMPSWIAALKTYNSRQPAWCIPRKGTDEYNKVRKIMSGEKTKKPKILKQVDSFKKQDDSFKKQDDIYEEPRNIQRTPTAVINTKRATIIDVPPDVMNHIMGKYLGVADKAKLATVGVKVKMTDEEKEEADRKSYNYKLYMNYIDRFKEYWDDYFYLTKYFNEIDKPDEKDPLYFLYSDVRYYINSYSRTNILKLFRVDDKKKKGDKAKDIIIDYNERKLTLIDRNDNNKVYKTNEEIFSLMKLPLLSVALQRKSLREIDSDLKEQENPDMFNNAVFLVKNGFKNKNNPLYTEEKLQKIIRYAVIYDAIKEKQILKKNIKLNYDVEYINKNLLLKKVVRTRGNWADLVSSRRQNYSILTYLDYVSPTPRMGDIALYINNNLYDYKGKDFKHSWIAKPLYNQYVTIFNMKHKEDPFSNDVLKKMEEDVKKIKKIWIKILFGINHMLNI